MFTSSIVNALPMSDAPVDSLAVTAIAEEAAVIEQSFEFINYINDLIHINSTIQLEHSASEAQDVWYQSAQALNSSIFVQYETLVNWNENKKPQGYISYSSSSDDESKDLTFFNYESNFSIKSSRGLIQFNSAEMTLAAKEETYQSIMEGITLDNDGFYKCSEYKNKMIEFELQGGKTLSIPLINLSWNHYQNSQDLCEPMISVLKDNSSSVDMIFGEYVMQNLLLSFQSKRLGVAPNAPGVTLA